MEELFLARAFCSNPRSPRRTIAICNYDMPSFRGSRVPILDRPEERSQSPLHHPHTHQNRGSNPRSPRRTIAIVNDVLFLRSADEFQSSIAPKNDRNRNRRRHQQHDLVPILDRPEERSQSVGQMGKDSDNNVPILDRPEERSQSN